MRLGTGFSSSKILIVSLLSAGESVCWKSQKASTDRMSFGRFDIFIPRVFYIMIRTGAQAPPLANVAERREKLHEK